MHAHFEVNGEEKIAQTETKYREVKLNTQVINYVRQFPVWLTKENPNMTFEPHQPRMIVMSLLKCLYLRLS